MWILGKPTRNSDAGDLTEIFFVSAVACFLGIRAFLELTGYPQVGGEGLHIAHMLWGGLLMLIALLLYFFFLDRHVHRFAAFLGGVGFGTFIDELGKFITDDNNYFYEPTVPILYIIFFLLYALLRSVQRRRRLEPRESLANALELTKSAGDGFLDRETKENVLSFLAHADSSNPLVPSLRSAVDSMPVKQSPGRSLYLKWKGKVTSVYESVIQWRWFTWSLTAFFLALAFLKVSAFVFLAWIAPEQRIRTAMFLGEEVTVQSLASFLEGLFIIIGAWKIRTDRLAAYRWFMRAVLVSLAISQVFLFYRAQLTAISFLVFVILLYSGLRFLILQEEEVQKTRSSQPSRAG